jgi:hypothetical protein
LEKTKNKLLYLSDTDNYIYSKAKDLVKILANKINYAKGHKPDESILTIKDIAHNLALNASLAQKLLKAQKLLEKDTEGETNEKQMRNK